MVPNYPPHFYCIKPREEPQWLFTCQCNYFGFHCLRCERIILITTSPYISFYRFILPWLESSTTLYVPATVLPPYWVIIYSQIVLPRSMILTVHTGPRRHATNPFKVSPMVHSSSLLWVAQRRSLRAIRWCKPECQYFKTSLLLCDRLTQSQFCQVLYHLERGAVRCMAMQQRPRKKLWNLFFTLRCDRIAKPGNWESCVVV